MLLPCLCLSLRPCSSTPHLPPGLVHITPGESSEVIPLSEWLRFSTLFNVLRNIRYHLPIHNKNHPIEEDTPPTPHVTHPTPTV